jgi:hypothetical protein
MNAETESIRVTSVTIALEDQTITLESDAIPVAKLRFSLGSIYFEPLRPVAEGQVSDLGQDAAAQSSTTVEDLEPVEKDRPVILQGKILGRVREGRPDSRGRKTAWGRFAAHDDGAENAHLYSATFHRACAGTVLGLPPDSHLVVEGYIHPSTDPEGGRLDSLSVFRLVKRAKPPQESAG